eukprot:328395-Chlamydomonas_euryale.AAC.3
MVANTGERGKIWGGILWRRKPDMGTKAQGEVGRNGWGWAAGCGLVGAPEEFALVTCEAFSPRHPRCVHSRWLPRFQGVPSRTRHSLPPPPPLLPSLLRTCAKKRQNVARKHRLPETTSCNNVHRDSHGAYHITAQVACGSGLALIYEFLLTDEVGNRPDVLRNGSPKQPPEVASGALDGSDPLAVEAVDMFLNIIGAEAGAMALRCLAGGGVYIAGGITPKLMKRVQHGALRDGFLMARGREKFHNILIKTPLYVITNDSVGKIGTHTHTHTTPAYREGGSGWAEAALTAAAGLRLPQAAEILAQTRLPDCGCAGQHSRNMIWRAEPGQLESQEHCSG